MLKSTAGGGGIGMRRCNDARELRGAVSPPCNAWPKATSAMPACSWRSSSRARGTSRCRSSATATAASVALGERDCSVQRRNQKVIEEISGARPQRRGTPRTCTTRRRAWAAASAIVRPARSSSSTTRTPRAFYFLEVNTRLQVEHGVTEEVGGIDLVEWMIRTAAGEPPDLASFQFVPRGHAIQARVYAEDPARSFRPSSGLLTRVELPRRSRPGGLRVDGWIEAGTEVTGYYDPMLAKIIARGDDRDAAIAQLAAALDASNIHGIETNLRYLCSVLRHPVFARGEQTTSLLASHALASPSIEVLIRRHDDARCRTGREDWASGMWACRPRARWMRWRCGWRIAWSAMRKVPPRWR